MPSSPPAAVDDESGFGSAIYVLAAAWLISYALGWLGNEDEPLRWLGENAASSVGRSSDPYGAASEPQPLHQQPSLPAGHPPVPTTARSRCAAGLSAAAEVASSGQPWLESPYVVAGACVVLSALTIVRRVCIERGRQRRRPTACDEADDRGAWWRVDDDGEWAPSATAHERAVDAATRPMQPAAAESVR